MTLMTLVLSNNYKIKLMKQKVSLLNNLFAQNQIEYYNCESINVMQLQMVRAFNRIRTISKSNLNLIKRNECFLRGITLDSKSKRFKELIVI